MSEVAQNSYLAGLLAGHAPAVTPLAWFDQLRAHAVDRVSALTVPTTRDEDWRFTDISPLTKISFQPARAASALKAADIERFARTEAGARLVFVDGTYAPDLSFNRTGIEVGSLAAGLSAHGAVVQHHLARHAVFEANAFAALNAAFLNDGALIVVPRNQAVAAAVHVLFIATQAMTASYPRCLLIAESGSSVTLLEEYVALQDAAYFTNAVTEIAVADDAIVRHVRVQREEDAAFHIANGAFSLGRASRYDSVSVAFGARISRYNLGIVQNGDGSECAVDGLAMIKDGQLADTHTTIDHAHPHGVSRQQHKCIVDDTAHAVFNGRILVRHGAQLTNSAQSSRNLLLSPRARVDTKPQLEIFADDVKCAHGATVGQLDADELFYLKSRGLSETVARNLLTYAFGAEIIERIAIPSLKRELENTVLAQTSRPT